MADSYKQLCAVISSYVDKLRVAAPDVMQGFSSMAAAATKNGALDTKTKEFIALGIAVAARCDGCIGFHTQKLHKLGATETEVVETLSMAVYMGGGPSLMYAAEALKSFQEFAA